LIVVIQALVIPLYRRIGQYGAYCPLEKNLFGHCAPGTRPKPERKTGWTSQVDNGLHTLIQLVDSTVRLARPPLLLRVPLPVCFQNVAGIFDIGLDWQDFCWRRRSFRRQLASLTG